MFGGGVMKERGLTAAYWPLMQRWQQATAAAPRQGRGVAAAARDTGYGNCRNCSLTYPFGVGARGSCVGFLPRRGRGPQLQY